MVSAARPSSRTSAQAASRTSRRVASARSARLSRLATNLLELSRLDAAPPVAARATARELETELMDSVDRLRTIAGGAGPEIELDTAIERADAPYPLSVSAFSRILDNLGANAIAVVGLE